MEDFIVLTLGHAQTHHPWRCEDISSPFLRLYYVKSGRAVVHLPDGDVEATPDHLYLFSAYEPHAYECDPGFEFYYLFVFQRKQERLGIFDRYEFPREVNANRLRDCSSRTIATSILNCICLRARPRHSSTIRPIASMPSLS